MQGCRKSNKLSILGVVCGVAVLMLALGLPAAGLADGEYLAQPLIRRIAAAYLVELELDKSQRQEIAGILSEYRAVMRPMVDELIDARIALFDSVGEGYSDHTAVLDAQARVHRIEQALVVLRADCSREIRGVLREDQLAAAASLRERMKYRLLQRVADVRMLLDEWIAEQQQ